MSPVYSDPVRAYSSNSSSTRFINSLSQDGYTESAQ